MALSSTIFSFDLNISDVDRSVYETLTTRVAQHPTETDEYMLTRVLAYCLEYQDNIEFGKSVGADDAAVFAKDLTGKYLLWVEIGLPNADKLHRVSKLSERVAIYTHRIVSIVKSNLDRRAIYNASAIPIYSFERGFIASLVSKLDRRNQLNLSFVDQRLFIELNGFSAESALIKDDIEP
jgi:uncharacterized protein YaeQ